MPSALSAFESLPEDILLEIGGKLSLPCDVLNVVLTVSAWLFWLSYIADSLYIVISYAYRLSPDTLRSS